MMNYTPEILENSVQLIVDNQPIDYHICFDVTGRVYETKSLIFDLPEVAQKLILGDKGPEFIERIEAYGNLIELLLPLCMVDRLPSFNERFEPVIQKIKKAMKQKSIPYGEVYQYARKNSLEFYILGLFQNPKAFAADFFVYWTKVIGHLENMDFNLRTGEIKYLIGSYSKFGFKVLSLIIPLIKDSDTKKIAFTCLGDHQAEYCQAFLLKQLKKNTDPLVANGILSALAEQDNTKKTEVQRAVVDYYYSGIEHTQSAKNDLLVILQSFPNKQTYEIGEAILKENTNYASSTAATFLLNIGYSRKKMAKLLLPFLEAAEPNISEVAFTTFSENWRLMWYLPKPQHLLDIYVKTIEREPKLSIITAMTNILIEKHNDETIAKLIRLLDHESNNVLEGVLRVIHTLINDRGVKNRYLKKPLAKKKYFGLLQHQNMDIVRYAIFIVSDLGKLERRREYVIPLLDIIKFSDARIDGEAMYAINEIMERTQFEPLVKEKYLKALEQEYYNYREAALKGFRYSKDKALKKSLLYLKEDPSIYVRMAADYLY